MLTSLPLLYVRTCMCLHTVGCRAVSFLPSAKCLCAPRVCLLAFKGACVVAHTYSPLIQCYGVSTAVLNNAKSLRLTTEQTQWGLSAQDIPSVFMLCCRFVPSQTE